MFRFLAGVCAGIMIAGAYPQAEDWLRFGAEKTTEVAQKAKEEFDSSELGQKSQRR
jgi:hypothetical protein